MSDRIISGVWEYEKRGKRKACITGYNGGDTNVIVPETIDEIVIEAIGNFAFKDKEITSITLPDTLTTIGESAFEGCKNLSQVKTTYNQSHHPRYIYPNAFKHCYKLVAPNGFLIVNDYLLEYFVDEVNLAVPEGVISIAEGTFSNKNNLVSVILPDSLKAIGMNAFINCPNLSMVKTKNEFVGIGGISFTNCPKLFDKDGYFTFGNSHIVSTDEV